ncbi:MAG: Bile acid:sodium symporter [Holophagaceae bacterium]|nr:Bile acid:sodium symporter [Holophagaceae bacterium]
MWKILQTLNRQLVWAIPGALVLGYFTGILLPVKGLKSLVLPLTFLMVYPMTVNLKIQSLFNHFDTRLHLATALLNFGVYPFVAYGLGRLFFPHHPFLALGLLMASLVPTSGMTISWTGMTKGNMPAAIQMAVIGLIVGSLATPVYVQSLMGAQVAVSWKAVFTQIGAVVFLPLILGQLTRFAFEKRIGVRAYAQTWAPRFPGLSTLGVLGVVFVAMALKAQDMTRNPGALPRILVPLAVLYLVNFVVSTWVGRRFFPREDALALVFGTVLRNLSIALAVAMTAFGAQGAEAAIVISLAYVFQVLSAAWYARWTPRIFPDRPAETTTQPVTSA